MIHTIVMLESMAFPPSMDRVAEIAGGHHETLDGRGYPRGLTAEQLSIPARILAIADIFEALTASDRPSKQGMPLSQSLAILANLRDRGRIDADLFDLFLRSGVYLTYAQRFLATGQIDPVDLEALRQPGFQAF
jgi:HD-GYP domain-containing protein (c-di-GMP phosphodiesterase class II)